MEADAAQAVLCQDAVEAAGQTGRADALARLVEADVPLAGAAVRLAAQALALFLLGLQALEHVPHRRHQRQRPAAPGMEIAGITRRRRVFRTKDQAHGKKVANCHFA